MECIVQLVNLAPENPLLPNDWNPGQKGQLVKGKREAQYLRDLDTERMTKEGKVFAHVNKYCWGLN